MLDGTPTSTHLQMKVSPRSHLCHSQQYTSVAVVACFVLSRHSLGFSRAEACCRSWILRGDRGGCGARRRAAGAAELEVCSARLLTVRSPICSLELARLSLMQFSQV